MKGRQIEEERATGVATVVVLGREKGEKEPSEVGQIEERCYKEEDRETKLIQQRRLEKERNTRR